MKCQVKLQLPAKCFGSQKCALGFWVVLLLIFHQQVFLVVHHLWPFCLKNNLYISNKFIKVNLLNAIAHLHRFSSEDICRNIS